MCVTIHPPLEDLYRDFGRRLRAARKGAQLTQGALASRVGLSRTSITNIEQGSQHVALHLLMELARAVGVTPAQLLPDVDGARGDVAQALGAGGLSPKAQAQVKRTLQGLPKESQQWVYRVVRGGTRNGDRDEG